MASGPNGMATSMANGWGNNGNSERLHFLGLFIFKIIAVTEAMKLKHACSLEEKL